MKIIGITGGVGSGKSSVLAYFEQKYGATICQADHVAWELQRQGEPCYKEIVKTFGGEILDDNLAIDRRKLGEIVFSDEEKLLALNAIMHPAVKQSILKQIASEKEKGTLLFVLEAALLLEDNYDVICDELWYVYADEMVRRTRLKKARAYSDEKIDAIMAAQVSEEIYRKGCQKIIDNSGTFEETKAQLKEILE